MAQTDPHQSEFSDMASGPSPSQHVRRSSHMQLPWMWLAIGFVVILALGAVVYLASGSGPAQPLTVAEPTVTATAASQPTATPRRPAATLTSAPEPSTAPTTSPVASEGEIEPGVEVKVTGTGVDGLSIRSGPGKNYARLSIAGDGEILTVLEGPQEADGYRWWRVRDDKGTVGWGVGDWLQPTGE
jgi:hypothetical protein